MKKLVLASVLVGGALSSTAWAREFLAMPGLWVTMYQVSGEQATTGAATGDSAASAAGPVPGIETGTDKRGATGGDSGRHRDRVDKRPGTGGDGAPNGGVRGDTAPVNAGFNGTIAWHCVTDDADPWVAYAQLKDLPGMTCSRTSQQRSSTSLKWQASCRGPGVAEVADVVEVSGAVVFDSAQHYTGWGRISGRLMGYPVQSGAKIEGRRKAACTSPTD